MQSKSITQWKDSCFSETVKKWSNSKQFSVSKKREQSLESMENRSFDLHALSENNTGSVVHSRLRPGYRESKHNMQRQFQSGKANQRRLRKPNRKIYASTSTILGICKGNSEIRHETEMTVSNKLSKSHSMLVKSRARGYTDSEGKLTLVNLTDAMETARMPKINANQSINRQNSNLFKTQIPANLLFTNASIDACENEFEQVESVGHEQAILEVANSEDPTMTSQIEIQNSEICQSQQFDLKEEFIKAMRKALIVIRRKFGESKQVISSDCPETDRSEEALSVIYSHDSFGQINGKKNNCIEPVKYNLGKQSHKLCGSRVDEKKVSQLGQPATIYLALVFAVFRQTNPDSPQSESKVEFGQNLVTKNQNLIIVNQKMIQESPKNREKNCYIWRK